jgi:hypothetical protein
MHISLLTALAAVLSLHSAHAHSQPDSTIADFDGDWATWHMSGPFPLPYHLHFRH